MKDLTEAFKSDVFRLLVIYVLPGGLLVYPCYRVLLELHPIIAGYMPGNTASRIAVLTALATVAGMFLEDLGSLLERGFDWVRQECGEDVNGEWGKYLKCAFKAEPVGQRYIRTIVLRMKFELSMTSVMFVLLIGSCLVTLPQELVPLTCKLRTSMLVVGLFCAFQAYLSTGVLHNTRERLNAGVIEVP